jgi:hypothetical protein
MDHLVGVRMRDQLQIAPEGGLKEAFQGTGTPLLRRFLLGWISN